MRIGQGYDVHRFAPQADKRPLILGGTHIPYGCGLAGHSDADVLAHAISDALLGAAALGDIGGHFPDTEAAYKDADSLVLLSKVCEMVRRAGFEICNIDATVVAQAPRLSGFIPEMRKRLAAAVGTDAGRVSVKATTEEGLGFTGEGLGISAHAVVLLDE
ncbi:MAG TPA: 2-C-methyl-D-erythritol 2,4-cyclodiphosphate synthase [Clostridiales bacterium]|nr:2-C-methyl-D-erythritol 2,4-cyclodiphosphate synthase [Clostridiales bacterium]